MTKPTVRTVKMHKAKSTLSQLVAEVEGGGEIILMRGNVPVARLVGIEPRPKRVFGSHRGEIVIGPDFFDPLPEEELRLWYGGDDP